MLPIIVLALAFLVPLSSIAVGVLVALLLGRPAQFWRISVPLFLGIAAAAIIFLCWPPRLGVDMAGGTVLVYEIRSPDELGGEQTHDAAEVAAALRRRIDPGGFRDLIIRSNRRGQIEILMGAHEADLVDQVRQRVGVAGYLEFRVVANPVHHERLCALAEQANGFEDKLVKDPSGRIVGRWVRVGRPSETGFEEDTIGRFSRSELGDMHTRTRDDGVVEALTVEDVLHITGKDIADVSAGFGGMPPGPIVNFRMTRKGAIRFGALTGTNVPDDATGQETKLGIVLDGELLSAPRIISRITDRGQITGRFSKEEVDFIVAILKAGCLPASLNPAPISEYRFPPGQRLQWAKWCVAGTMAALLLVVMLAVFWFGRRAVGAAAAMLSAFAMFAAAVLAIRVPLTFPAVLVACGGVLVLAIVLLLLSRTVNATPPAPGEETDSVPSASLPTGALILVAVLGVVFIATAVITVVGVGEMRQFAVLLAMVSLSGAASIILCFWPLLGLFHLRPKRADDDWGTVTADRAE